MYLALFFFPCSLLCQWSHCLQCHIVKVPSSTILITIELFISQWQFCVCETNTSFDAVSANASNELNESLIWRKWFSFIDLLRSKALCIAYKSSVSTVYIFGRINLRLFRLVLHISPTMVSVLEISYGYLSYKHTEEISGFLWHMFSITRFSLFLYQKKNRNLILFLF